MSTSIMTTKGRITLPKSVRTSMKLEAGSKVEFVEGEHGQFFIIPAIKSVQLLKGMLQKPRMPISVEQMNRAIANQAIDKKN